jgi:hypothetical protein
VIGWFSNATESEAVSPATPAASTVGRIVAAQRSPEPAGGNVARGRQQTVRGPSQISTAMSKPWAPHLSHAECSGMVPDRRVLE